MLKIKNILCAFIILFTILKPINMLNANNTIINSRRLNSANYFTSESEHLITSNPDDPRSVFAIDLDDDGDIDVIVASNRDDTVAWYENNGSESFTEHVITTNADAARVVIAIDLDGDGDIDVIVGSTRDDTVAWYENNGSESFTEHIITTNADQVYFKNPDCILQTKSEVRAAL